MPEQNDAPDEAKLKALQEAEELQKARKGIKPGRKRPDQYTAQGLSPDQVKNLTPLYNNIGPKPLGFGLDKWKWYIARHKERKKLRKDLRENYHITKWRDFEMTAREVGLGIDNPLISFLMNLLGRITTLGGLASILGAAALLLAGLFAYSYVSEQAGSFTVQINPNTMKAGFTISETPDFENPTARLDSNELRNVNAITIADIPYNIDEKDGMHNGDYYVAYTFYIKNAGDETSSYEYILSLTDSMFGADKAIWVMLFEDGHQIIYADLSADGDAERLYGYGKPPFYETAYNPDEQYYQKTWSGAWGIVTKPTVRSTDENDDTTIVRGLVENIEPGEVHKYTVVIWLEGNDPECTDDLFGGYARYMMQFDTVTEEKKNLFSAIYRTEYDNYGLDTTPTDLFN